VLNWRSALSPKRRTQQSRKALKRLAASSPVLEGRFRDEMCFTGKAIPCVSAWSDALVKYLSGTLPKRLLACVNRLAELATK
jgi:hypothetical protein